MISFPALKYDEWSPDFTNFGLMVTKFVKGVHFSCSFISDLKTIKDVSVIREAAYCRLSRFMMSRGKQLKHFSPSLANPISLLLSPFCTINQMLF